MRERERERKREREWEGAGEREGERKRERLYVHRIDAVCLRDGRIYCNMYLVKTQ